MLKGLITTLDDLPISLNSRYDQRGVGYRVSGCCQSVISHFSQAFAAVGKACLEPRSFLLSIRLQHILQQFLFVVWGWNREGGISGDFVIPLVDHPGALGNEVEWLVQ